MFLLLLTTSATTFLWQHSRNLESAFLAKLRRMVSRLSSESSKFCVAGLLQPQVGVLGQGLGHGVAAIGLPQAEHKNRLRLLGVFRINKKGWETSVAHLLFSAVSDITRNSCCTGRFRSHNCRRLLIKLELGQPHACLEMKGKFCRIPA